jgi:hypothetical protein
VVMATEVVDQGIDDQEEDKDDPRKDQHRPKDAQQRVGVRKQGRLLTGFGAP